MMGVSRVLSLGSRHTATGGSRMTLPSKPVYPTPETKVCTKCHIEKSWDDFQWANIKFNYKQSVCRLCRKEIDARRVIQIFFPTAKVCSHPECQYKGNEQPISSFKKNPKKKDGHDTWCKDCFNRYQEIWKLKNPEKTKSYWEEWAINNPGKRKESSTRQIIIHQKRAEILKEMGITSEKKFRLGWASVITSTCSTRAKKKGVPFNMKASDLLDVNTGKLPEFCPIFPHVRLDYNAGPDRRCWASVDRIVPELGYTKGNVAVISNGANTWKSNGSNAAERARIVEIMTGRKTKIEPNEKQPSLFGD